MVDLSLIKDIEICPGYIGMLRLWLIYSHRHLKVKGTIPLHTFAAFVAAMIWS